jgi:outer membrane protein assembly factor BamB
MSVGSAAVAAGLPPTHGSGWPQFRGPDRNGVSKETGLLRKWPAAGPKRLWSVPVAEGYAGAAIVAGRVYHHDYDEAKSEWSINCRSLDAGELIWQFREPREIRPNHAITRTIPAVDSRFVCSLDPKAVLHCLDAKTGKEIWRKNLVTEYQASIPSWYNGQCPLQEGGRIVVATGGAAILVALDKPTGKEIWRTPNPNHVVMTHSSVMPAVLGGVRQYLYGTLQGPLGVAAADGKLLWEFPRKFNVAVAPSPIAVDQERVFMTASYDAGSVMIRVRHDGVAFKTECLFDLKNNEWNSEVHTPIVHKSHLFAVGKKKRGLFTCLDFDGKEVWSSDGKASFGLGSFMLADGMFLVMDGNSGTLRLIEASATAYNEIASAQVLAGQEVWAPMALSDGKLVLRDLNKMICLDLRG